ncbi:MAG TPA: AMIN domain-containing protein [Terriglobales bacterium]|nr:AMIN domain-containing protein [Terriglobales bacterium]
MQFPPKAHLASIFALLLLSVTSLAARQTVVRRISISSATGPLQINVQTSAPATPQAEVISGPDRLVIDVPGAIPAISLRNQVVNRGQVTRIRVGLFSAIPPVTRIVLDLNSPQSYRINPAASGFAVTVGGESSNSETTAQNTSSGDQSANRHAPSDANVIGWVSAAAISTNVAAKPRSFIVKQNPPEPAKPVLVEYANGQLEIHAHDALLFDVLAMIHQQTGAEIAIPAFTREERVVGDFGPGGASEVLAQLLNGTNMNFVVVASPTDPSVLRNVILSLKPEGGAEYIPPDNSAQAVNTVPSDNNEVPPPVVEPRPEDVPQSQPPDAPAPIQDAPQN